MTAIGRKWKYTVNRWAQSFGGRQHYHVTLFPDGDLRSVFSVQSDVNYQQKFNTQEESERFIKKVRRKLNKEGIKLALIRKDLRL